MMRLNVIILLLVTTTFSLNASIRYVDNTASGNNTGSSWSNAWKSFSDISGLSTGDIVYISGGIESKEYNETLFCTEGVTYRTGLDSGHNGIVVIDAQFERKYGIVLEDNVTISGMVDSTRKMLIKNSLDSGLQAGIVQGVRIKFIEVTNCGSEGAGGGFAHGIHIGHADGCEVAYCYIHQNYRDAINANGSIGTNFGNNKVHHCILQHNNDDGVACRNGFDIYDNIIGNCYRHPGGPEDPHSDGIQAQGEYTRIWNNEIYNCHTHGIFADPLNVENGANHIHIYNNIVYRTQDFIDSGHHMHGIKVKAERGTPSMNDIYICNNTVVDMGYGGISIENCLNTTNVDILNNILYNCRADGPTGYVLGTDDDNGNIDYNVIYNGQSGGSNLLWNGNNYDYSTFVNVGFGQLNGSTNRPLFIKYIEFANDNDFMLTEFDITAKENGKNLISDEIIQDDKAGILRPASGPWDIGAFQAQEASENTPPPNFRFKK